MRQKPFCWRKKSTGSGKVNTAETVKGSRMTTPVLLEKNVNGKRQGQYR
jgi:hypothetical protein